MGNSAKPATRLADEADAKAIADKRKMADMAPKIAASAFRAIRRHILNDPDKKVYTLNMYMQGRLMSGVYTDSLRHTSVRDELAKILINNGYTSKWSETAGGPLLIIQRDL